jgi:hypothetical protein
MIDKISLLGNRSLQLEFPVQHINYHPVNKAFQVETGPVLFVQPEFIYKEKMDLLREPPPKNFLFTSTPLTAQTSLLIFLMTLGNLLGEVVW